MNKFLIIANWKMNPENSDKAKALFDSIKQGVGDLQNTKIVVCPPFVYLYDIGYPTSKIKLGAQDCFWEQSGAFTGEISPEMLKNLGCEYVILGHSERRRDLGETDEMIGKKLAAASDAGLKPILCIGESQEQRKQGKAEEALKQQLTNILKNVSNVSGFRFQVSGLCIVYEPIWAIGTGTPCNSQDAKKALSFLKEHLSTYYENGSRSGRIIYGGSVDSNNTKDYIDAGFDGLLVGNASLNPEEFIKIIDLVEKF